MGTAQFTDEKNAELRSLIRLLVLLQLQQWKLELQVEGVIGGPGTIDDMNDEIRELATACDTPDTISNGDLDDVINQWCERQG